MAKYISVNELDKFSLHDATFVTAELQDNNMIWTLEHANVTTKNSQNGFNCDMEADEIRFTYYGFQIKNFYINEVKHYDKMGKLIGKRPSIPIPASEYKKTIQNFTEDSGRISNHKKCNGDSPFCYSFDILTYADSYIFTFEYSKVIAEWDSFISKAWYVDWDKKN